ncbi:hypothetical protein NDU88_007824 [Pleurodeles waltl]|uniref:Uncharacterized protein n=1 Tax=Pleurodeles waltl TaxID=8319 RepID=A0AAV7RW72_PLEWA|nr:hypothetical protein NDU88_007824 [Pleurodeles waltl]
MITLSTRVTGSVMVVGRGLSVGGYAFPTYATDSLDGRCQQVVLGCGPGSPGEGGPLLSGGGPVVLVLGGLMAVVWALLAFRPDRQGLSVVVWMVIRSTWDRPLFLLL